MRQRDPSASLRMTKNVAIIQIDPGHTLAINQGPLMGAIIFRRREHLSERQRVVRTLKIMASMGPIARVWPGSIRTQHSTLNTHHPSPNTLRTNPGQQIRAVPKPRAQPYNASPQAPYAHQSEKYSPPTRHRPYPEQYHPPDAADCPHHQKQLPAHSPHR